MSRLTDMAEQITQALNYIQPTETDVPELEERRKAIHRSLMDTRELLRAASAETVGTEWGFIQHAWEHNADLHAARLAIADLRAERDAKQRAIDEAFAVLDAGHGILACREAAHILRPHATKATEAKQPRQWTSTPPTDSYSKWWQAFGGNGTTGIALVPDDLQWSSAMIPAKDYTFWLPWQEGDTADDLPPLPTNRHAPLNLPADRTKMIERACEADDGACSTGSTPATADDTRELVARLAEFIHTRWTNPGSAHDWRAELEAIIAAARRGGGG